MSREDKWKQAKIVAEIMGSEADEIVNELKRKQSAVSKEEILNAAKKRQDKIVLQLRSAGLEGKELQARLSWIGKIVMIKLKKEIGKDAIRGMVADKLETRKRRDLMAEEIARVSKGKGMTGSVKEGLSRFHGNLKFREQLVKKIEEAIYEMTGTRYKVGAAMKQYMTLEKPFFITAKSNGKSYDVILKEIDPKNFYDPTVLKVAKYMGINRYKIKPFKIKPLTGKLKHYAIIQKVPGRNIISLRLNSRYIRGLERQYLKELGKIVAFTYICAIPDRTSDNIICNKIKYDIQLTTFDFAKSFNYRKYPPLKAALTALDMNAPFLKDIAKENKDALKAGFIESFNLAKENQAKFSKYIKPLKYNPLPELKKILKQDPEEVFDELVSKSKFFK